MFTLIILLYGSTPNETLQPKAALDSIISIKHFQPDKALEIGFQLIVTPHPEITDSIIAYANHEIASILYEQGFASQAMVYYVKALDYYLSEGKNLAVGWFYNDIGNIYFSQRMFDKAKEKFLIARDIFIKTGVLYAEATVVNNLALLAVEQGDNDKAMHLFHEALNLRIQYGDEPFLLAHSYKYIGDLLLKMDQVKEAMSYFQKIINLGIPEGDGNIKGLSYRSIGEIFAKRGEFNEAIHHFKLAEESFISDYYPNYLSELYVQISDLFFENSNQDSAEYYLKKAIPITEENGLLESQIDILTRLVSIKEGKMEFIVANSYLKTLDKLRKSRYESEIKQSLNRAEIQLELSANLRKLAEKESQIKFAKMQRNFLIILGIISLLLGWNIYRRYIQSKELLKHHDELHTHQLTIEHLKVEQAQKEIDIKKNELMAKVTLIQQKNDVIEKFKEELKYHINLLTKKEDRQHFVPLVSSLNGIVESDKNWMEFEKHFSEMYPEFLSKITRSFPDITPTEIKMCSYLKMNMNTKEIALLTGSTVRAIEIRRHRLRKKLNVPKGENLTIFLAVFSS